MIPHKKWIVEEGPKAPQGGTDRTLREVQRDGRSGHVAFLHKDMEDDEQVEVDTS
ncbi:MAG: hypothetical protein QMB98_00175 [Flaviflexus sp.]